MTEVVDRRQQKTRAALHAAFRVLLFERGYQALTIGMVAEHANVGRSTFYEHYRTKDDLLRASVQEPFSALADLAGTAWELEPLKKRLLHFREHQQIARVLLGWETRPVLTSALSELLVQRLRDTPQTQSLLPAELIARQIAAAQLTLLDAWISGRPAIGIDVAADSLIASTRALVQLW